MSPEAVQKMEVIKQPDEIKMEEEYSRLETLRSNLMTTRAPYLKLWEDAQFYIDPSLVIWSPSTSGYPDLSKVFISSFPFQAFDDLMAGLQTGITPENQDWHSIEPEDEELKTDEPSIEWCHKLNELYKWTFQNSNFYQESPIFYRSASRFLTAAMMCEEDFQNRCRFTVFPIGSYYCSNNGLGQVDTFIFETRYKLRQIVDLFCEKLPDGKPDVTNLGDTLQIAWKDPKQHENPYNMVWAIEPNWADYNQTKAKYNSKFKRYKASYYVRDSAEKKIIQQKGFDEFPVPVFRWYRQPTDAYGVDGPGRKAIGDVREIFWATGMWNNAVAKVIEPPMVAPPEVGQYPMGTVPGFLNVAPGAAKGNEGFRPAYQIQPDLKAIQEKRMELKTCIDKTCFADVFRMIANTDKTQPETATYWLQRIQENYNVIAPVYGNFEHDWLKPLFRIMYKIFERQGAFKQGGPVGPPPPQLAAKGLKWNIISSISSALKMKETTSYDKAVLFTTETMKVNPQAGDVLDTDKLNRRYYKALNIIGVAKDEDQVAQVRQARAKQAAAQAKAEAMPKIGKGVKDMAAAHSQLSEGQENQQGEQ